jgi:sorting nexin-8
MLPVLNAPTMILPVAADLAAKPPQLPKTPSQAKSPAKPRNIRKDSLEDADADPWGSPAMHKGHNHESGSKINGISRSEVNGVSAPVRTTSNFTTTSIDDSTHGNTHNQPAETPTSTGDLCVSYDGGSSFGGGSGGDGDRPAQAPAQSRSFGGGRVMGNGIEEIIQISLLPEKEGMFMFQHHNYQVSSSRRGSKVVRRYSDFVWLLDCLQKRYPFRQLPLLPPKRVGGM